jgi:poly(3-hydroxybutyrate) depolymerase
LRESLPRENYEAIAAHNQDLIMTSRIWITAILAGFGTAAAAQAAEPLPSFEADPSGTSVSGLSSGAYMAGQFHVAFSDTVIGAAIVAGGPYDCAEGTLGLALDRCMQTSRGVPDPARLLARARQSEAQGAIDPLAGLAGDAVYVFSGTRDETVTPPVVATVADFYRQAGVPEARIAVVDDMPAGHAFITEAEGNACELTGPPFVNDCDYDQAGAILAHLHGPLEPPAADPGGRILEFDQAAFLGSPTAHGLAETGFLYVPAACEAGGCRVHVAFHGCKQTESLVGDAFVRGTGFNRWADTNRLIMLYPQARNTLANPNSCWDWWGYDDPAYATKTGRQMAAIKRMVDRLAGIEGGDCGRFDGSNLAHWQAGRARVCDWWFLCAVGSGDRLGLAVSSTTLFESPPGTFSTTACAA